MGTTERYGTDIKMARLFNMEKGYPYLPVSICKKHRDEVRKELNNGKHSDHVLQIANIDLPEPNEFCAHCAIESRKEKS